MTEVPKKKKNYINNADLLKELELSHAQDRMTEELGKMLLLLCKRYVQIPRFSRYTYTDDMQGFALMTLAKVWRGFNAERSNNPFAYFTQCIHHAYFQFNNAERKQRDIKDEIRIKNGLNPSFNYSDRINGTTTEHDATGDIDYMDIHDSIDPYKDDDVEDSAPTNMGDAINLDPSEVKILEIGAEFFSDAVIGVD